MECGAKGLEGKDKDGSQVLHLQAGKADDLDLSNLYPDAQVVSDRIYSLVKIQLVSRHSRVSRAIICLDHASDAAPTFLV